MKITTQKELRGFFWDIMYPRYTPKKGYTQNDYCTDVRMAWVDFVDDMRRDNRITEKLANDCTL